MKSISELLMISIFRKGCRLQELKSGLKINREGWRDENSKYIVANLKNHLAYMKREIIF